MPTKNLQGKYSIVIDYLLLLYLSAVLLLRFQQEVLSVTGLFRGLTETHLQISSKRPLLAPTLAKL